jgi:hypothetical protein
MDPQQAQAQAIRMMALMVPFMIFGFICLIAIIFLLWRIFNKAGMGGPFSLLVLIPGIGPLVVLCILAFGEWKVVPIAPYGTLPPQYPPPPSYPPAGYPPAQ